MNVEQTIANLPNKAPAERERLRLNAEHLQATGNAGQKKMATRLLEALAAFAADAPQKLAARLDGMPASQRIVEAFKAAPMSETERKLVQVLLDHPGSTSDKLTAALGWGGRAWHMHFGTMCRNREAYLWPAAWAERRNAGFFSGILADLAGPENRFTMKPEAVAGFAALGIKGRAA